MHQLIKKENKFINSLIEKGKDNFEIHVAIQLQDLVDQIKFKRGVGSQAARKVATELIGEMK